MTPLCEHAVDQTPLPERALQGICRDHPDEDVSPDTMGSQDGGGWRGWVVLQNMAAGLGEVHMAGASRSARDQVGAAIGSEIRRADAQRRIARWGV